MPSLYKVLVEERDTYMAHELKKVTENRDGSLKPPVVVAVVGVGHVAGILEKIDTVTDQDVAEVVQVPPFYMVKIGFVLMTTYLAYQLCNFVM